MSAIEQKNGYVTWQWIVMMAMLAIGALAGYGYADIRQELAEEKAKTAANTEAIGILNVKEAILEERIVSIQTTTGRIESKLDNVLKER